MKPWSRWAFRSQEEGEEPAEEPENGTTEVGGNHERVAFQIQVKDRGPMVERQKGLDKKPDRGVWQCGDLWWLRQGQFYWHGKVES